MAYLLPQLATHSAAQHPDREAVVFEDRSITYRELDALSNRLAHALRGGGVTPGDRVGIYLNKGIESVVAILGIHKAGAAYVPLDPGAPVRRIAFIIGNCAMKAMVSSPQKAAGLREALPGGSPLQCLVLTGDAGSSQEEALGQARTVTWGQVLQMPDTPLPATGLVEDDLAYILYTSGSTGEPKGVAISHRASLTFVDWGCDTFQVRPQDRLANHAPLHFDLSTFDIFVALKAGATVVLVPESLSVFPRTLADFIEQQGITIWYSVPSVLTRLVLYGELTRHHFPQLRAVLFAGEVFPIKYLREFKAQVPHPQYYNLYGPTETNVCTYYQVKEQDVAPDRVEPLPIGKACANTDTFVLTDRYELAAPGQVGELFVRGPSLMKGYWGLPERTRQALVSDTVRSPWSGAQMYRTGDLVREDADGNYIFLGRRDNQIKSRGYRIELGEIETALYAHPKVEEAAVVAIPDDEIGNAIKAVVVAKAGLQVGRGELEHFCAQRIPKYMVPSMIEFRSTLPKTSTGKVDKPLLVKEHLAAQSTSGRKT
ncbi:MAG TPA: amino acid adenylation domain-containing protein [Dehalococcoidia bacterium]|nr:amino acid adenylation domain-containing protein [Dehalococcoidia bacterium]